MKINELHNQPVKADTYEASMALNQLLKIGKHAIKLHNMIDDDAEMESWVAKKIDLAGDYVKKVHGYMQGEKAGLYDDGGMSEARLQSNYAVSFQYPKGNHRRNSFASKDDAEKFADAVKNKGGIVDPIRLALGKNADDLSTSIRSLGEDAEEKTPQEKLAIMSKIEKIKKQSKDLAGDKDKDLIDKNKKILATLTKKLHEDAGDLTDQQKQGLTLLAKKYSGRKGVNGDPLIQGWIKARSTTGVTSDGWDSEEVQAWEKRTGKELSDWSPEDDKQFINQNEISRDMEDELLKVMGDPDFADKPIAGEVLDFLDDSMESVSEDAGEGHMSKSTLYHTAKYAIELMDMINKGDDLEGWVQSKLNKAADYLQGVHNYEEYQKLNPYREELDSNVLQKHAGIVQKRTEKILTRQTVIEA